MNEQMVFNNDVRLIDVQLELHIPNHDVLIINKDNYLISFELLEELSSNGNDMPFGAISANQFDFELYNNGDIFTPTNPNSIYYGDIDINMKVIVKLREELSDSEWIEMGTFYVYDWNCNQNNQVVTVTCNDRLQQIIVKNMPNNMIRTNVSAYDFIYDLFIGVGLKPAEFSIDVMLKSQIIRYAYPMKGSFGGTLSEFAISQLCYIYMSRLGVVTVKSISNITTPIGTWTDDNQIIECSLEQSLLKEYSSVRVECITKSITDMISILSLKDQVVEPSTTAIDNLIIENGPLCEITYVNCIGDGSVYCTMSKFTPWGMSLELVNTSKHNNSIEIDVQGKLINTSVKSYVERINDVQVNRIGDVQMEVKGEYIDDSVTADKICSMMYSYISSTCPMLTMLIRGNPIVKPGDVMSIHNKVNNITMEVVIISQLFKFNDSLECTVVCMDTSVLKGVSKWTN